MVYCKAEQKDSRKAGVMVLRMVESWDLKLVGHWALRKAASLASKWVVRLVPLTAACLVVLMADC